jgi:hypothetical protein
LFILAPKLGHFRPSFFLTILINRYLFRENIQFVHTCTSFISAASNTQGLLLLRPLVYVCYVYAAYRNRTKTKTSKHSAVIYDLWYSSWSAEKGSVAGHVRARERRTLLFCVTNERVFSHFLRPGWFVIRGSNCQISRNLGARLICRAVVSGAKSLAPEGS